MTGKSGKGRKARATVQTVKTPTKSPQTASDDEASDIDADSITVGTTMEQVRLMLETLLDEKLSKFEEKLLSKINDLQENLAATKNTAERALALAMDNKMKIETLSAENAVLQQRVSTLLTEKVRSLEEQIEDRTNRQMRKSIIFKGIEESPHETWNDTEEKLAKVMSEVTGKPLSETSEWIERGHRTGKPSTGKASEAIVPGDSNSGRYVRKGPRVITAGFYDWKDAQHVLDSFIKYNIQNKSKYSAEQKFGPLTTRRRNEALVERRKLITNRSIKSGFIAYPARLMVKNVNENSYRLYKDFSKMEITFEH